MLEPRISKLAVVEAQLDETAIVHEFAVIRKGVRFGKNVIIHPHVVVESGVTLGDDVEVFPYTFLGKTPKGASALTRQPVFKQEVVIDSHSCVGPNAVIYRDVYIGEGTLIGDGASIREQCHIGAHAVIGRHVTLNYAVIIGSGTKIMDHAWLAGNMTVGNDVFISGGVLTSNDNTMGTKDHGLCGPTIEDRARIGAGAVLLPGIVIGKRAIVGAGSVVTRDVAADTLVMGSPARISQKK